MNAPRDACPPVVLLLAAGEGSRFGGAKQLAQIAGEPMVRRVARMLATLDAPVVVVTGAHADEVEPALAGLPLSVVRCDDWQQGMGRSLACGVRTMLRMVPHARAVLVCLADQPLLEATLLRAMLERHGQEPDRMLATDHQDAPGPPALFPRRCFDALAALSGPHGARALLKQEAARLELFASPALIDVDTRDDLQRVHAVLAQRGDA